MRVPLSLAVDAAKLAGGASRLLHRGSGSTLPGVVARRLHPDVLARLSAQLNDGMLIVSATNGKTTTSRMLSSILRRTGRFPVHNRAGANLLSGLTAALVDDASPYGTLRSSVGLFEIDEATLPLALREMKPRVLLLMNLFRDQLDRYGELNTLALAWDAAIRTLPGSTHLILNVDDPLVARLAECAPGTVDFFGVDDMRAGIGRVEHTADSAICRCGSSLVYERVFYGHLGIYACPSCGWKRPRPTIRAVAIHDHGMAGTTCDVDVLGDQRQFELHLPGLYNVYNALAAAAAALRFDTPLSDVVTGLESFRAAFGRLERVQAADREFVLWLVKNPTGFNESLRTLLASPGPKPLAIFINDQIADGLDVSWLWDVDIEYLAERQSELPWTLVGGSRARDMAVRLKYAGIDTSRLLIVPNMGEAIEAMRHEAPAGLPVYCFPTYTAMLDLRGRMVRQGWAQGLRED